MTVSQVGSVGGRVVIGDVWVWGCGERIALLVQCGRVSFCGNLASSTMEARQDSVGSVGGIMFPLTHSHKVARTVYLVEFDIHYRLVTMK